MTSHSLVPQPPALRLPVAQMRNVFHPGDVERKLARLQESGNQREYETLRTVSSNLDWEPTGPVESLGKEGYRRARMGFTVPHSATLDVIEATRWNGDAGVYLNSWGPGPYYIRIAVTGLQAKADDLKARGTRFTWIDECEAVGGKSLIRVDPADVRGQLFEFEEY